MQLTIDQGTTIVDTRILNFPKVSARKKADSKLFYHLVFRASCNLDSVDGERRKDFYAFIFGCAHVLAGTIESIGGKGANLQIVVSLNPNETPADFIKKIKLFTASWAKRKMNLPDFAWLDVEVATLNLSECKRTMSYIQSRNFLF